MVNYFIKFNRKKNHMGTRGEFKILYKKGQVYYQRLYQAILRKKS